MTNAFQKFFGGQVSETAETPVKEPDRRCIGKVIKVSEAGWGFISCKEIAFTRIFFHWTSLKQETLRFPDLKVGMQVEFTPVEVQGKGTRAIKIVVKEDAPATDTTVVTETAEVS